MAGHAVVLLARVGRGMAALAARGFEQIGPAEFSRHDVGRRVARLAGLDLEVGALDVGPGLGMVEIRRIQVQEVGLPALMLGVADAAVFGLVAVEAPLGGDACGDLGVAGQALGRTDLARGDVAGRAIAFAGLGGVAVSYTHLTLPTNR